MTFAIFLLSIGNSYALSCLGVGHLSGLMVVVRKGFQGTFKNQDFFVRVRKLRAQNRSVWANT